MKKPFALFMVIMLFLGLMSNASAYDEEIIFQGIRIFPVYYLVKVIFSHM